MKFKEFEDLNLKTNELCGIKGGTSTTLVIEVGAMENEYLDTNGNEELDEEDKFIGTWDIDI